MNGHDLLIEFNENAPVGVAVTPPATLHPHKWEYYMRRFDSLYFRHPVKGKMVVRGLKLPEPLKYGTRVEVEWGLG
jgi:hypothetical protein